MKGKVHKRELQCCVVALRRRKEEEMTMYEFFVGVMRIDRIKSETINPEALDIHRGGTVNIWSTLRIECPGRDLDVERT